MLNAMAQGLAGAEQAGGSCAESDLDWLIQAVESMLRQAFPTLVIVGSGSATYFNEACRQLALAPSASQGGALADIAPSLSTQLSTALAAAWAGEATTAEGLHLQVDRVEGAQETWVNAAVSPVAREGRVCAVLCVLRDATEERRLRARLATAEATLESMAELTPAFLWRLDALGAIRWMNPRCQDYLGLGLKEAREHGWSGWLHPCDRARVMAEWGLSLAAPRPFESRHRLRDAGGYFRWFVVRALPQYNEAGELFEWHAAALEVLDAAGPSHSAERRLLWIADPRDWSRRYMNAGSASSWPSSGPDQAVSWDDLLNALVEDDRPALRYAFESLMSGRQGDAAYRARNRVGDILSIEETAYPIVEPDGSISRLMGESRIRAVVPAEVIMIDAARRGCSMRLALERDGFRVRVVADLSQSGLGRGAASAAVYCSDSTVPDILHAAEVFARDLPGLPVVVLGDPVASPREIMALHRAGVNDLLSYDAEDVAKARAVRESVEYLNQVNDNALPSSDTRDQLSRLSERERDILEQAVAGGTSKTIGRALGLSPRTVDFHRSKALDKLGLKAVSQASDLFTPQTAILARRS